MDKDKILIVGSGKSDLSAARIASKLSKLDKDIEVIDVNSIPYKEYQKAVSETSEHIFKENTFTLKAFNDYFTPQHVPQYIREAPKTQRNEPCPCGSGKKYKKCCG